MYVQVQYMAGFLHWLIFILNLSLFFPVCEAYFLHYLFYSFFPVI